MRLAAVAAAIALSTAACGGSDGDIDAANEQPTVSADSIATDGDAADQNPGTERVEVDRTCTGSPYTPTFLADSTIVRTNIGPARALLEQIRGLTELLATIDGAVYLRVSAPAADVLAALEVMPTFAAVDLVEPEHLYRSSQTTAGQLVDAPNRPGDIVQVPTAEPVSRSVAVIDATPDDQSLISQHGLFIQSILEAKGATTRTYPVPTTENNGVLEFREGDLIIAAGDIWNAQQAGEVYDNVALAATTYGCDSYEPGRPLNGALKQLGVPVVAPAGNDNVDQPTYPGALFVAVGSVSPDGPRSCFSNYGPWVDHWLIGEEVQSELPVNDSAQWATGTVTWTSTSFAAAQAAASELADRDPSASGTDRTPTNVVDPTPDYSC